MPNLASIRCGFYRIPLPVMLSDSTHGEMRAFELNTVRLTDAEGAEGVGYTYTAGRNGAAVHAILEHEITELFGGEEADEIERIWRKAWWALHYGGRGGPTVLAISAFDMALWDLKAKRARLPLWNLLGGFDARVPCYAGGIDLDLALDKLLRQTEDNLAKGFRAIKMKVGRKRLAEDVERVKTMRAHLGEGFPLMVDANMTWSVDEAIRAARAFSAIRPDMAGGTNRSGGPGRARPHRSRRRTADRRRREPPNGLGVQAVHELRWRNLSRAGRYKLRRGYRFHEDRASSRGIQSASDEPWRP